jgi:hypothetical protein
MPMLHSTVEALNQLEGPFLHQLTQFRNIHDKMQEALILARAADLEDDSCPFSLQLEAILMTLDEEYVEAVKEKKMLVSARDALVKQALDANLVYRNADGAEPRYLPGRATSLQSRSRRVRFEDE